MWFHFAASWQGRLRLGGRSHVGNGSPRAKLVDLVRGFLKWEYAAYHSFPRWKWDGWSPFHDFVPVVDWPAACFQFATTVGKTRPAALRLVSVRCPVARDSYDMTVVPTVGMDRQSDWLVDSCSGSRTLHAAYSHRGNGGSKQPFHWVSSLVSRWADSGPLLFPAV